MPVIVPCGFDDNEVFRLRNALRYLFEGTSVNPEDLTFISKEIPSVKVDSGVSDTFLLVFASNGWMAKQGQELVGKLTQDHEVCVVPLTVYQKGWAGVQL